MISDRQEAGLAKRVEKFQQLIIRGVWNKSLAVGKFSQSLYENEKLCEISVIETRHILKTWNGANFTTKNVYTTTMLHVI